MSTINLIQDIATPHNNVLIRQFKDCENVSLKLWYALDGNLRLYQWSSNITHEHFSAEIYGSKFSWNFIRHCISSPKEQFILVGWANTNTKILHLLFFLMRRPYNHWTDLPSKKMVRNSGLRQIFRWFFHKILRYSKAKIFCVGTITMDYFRKLGFSENRLVNLPIFVEIEENFESYRSMRPNIQKRYNMTEDSFVVSAGSRIVYSKGYDLLIRAVGLISPDIRNSIKVLIVGSGPCVGDLEQLIAELGLSKQIIIEKWLDISDFKALIANSNVFVHPARADAFGSTTLGMALGVPVIGAYQAGAAIDRINQGINGFLYNADDIQALANLITLLYQNPQLCRRMGQEARKTALSWPPKLGVDIIIEGVI